MNKSYKFKKGDMVTSKGYAGRVIGVRSVGGNIIGLQVELINGGAIKFFNPAETKLIEFDSNRPSNKYLESVLKAKQDKPSKVIKKDKTKVLTIDELLDRYNDHKRLYEEFGDVQYRAAMKDTLRLLKLASNGVPVMERINED
ncbi:MAG: hypothetical protein ACI35O_04045 [Bacillaceae bacterium]